MTNLQDFMNIAKALSDENRVRALMCLGRGELCLCQIIEVLGLATSTVSKHMAILLQAGLVHVRREGRWRYFRLAGDNAPPHVGNVLRWVMDSLSGDGTVSLDSARLEEIRKIPLEEFCVKTRHGKRGTLSHERRSP